MKNEEKILICDLDIEDPTLSLIFESLPKEFIRLDQSKLENNLIESFRSSNFDPKTTLLVFIGQSSLELKQKLLLKTNVFNKYKSVYVHAQRIYEPTKLPNGNETYAIRASVGKVGLQEYLNFVVKNIVVIDDVVSTGITLRKLHEGNTIYFPNAKWDAFTLISRLENLKNYHNLNKQIMVNNKFTPINTFSKLIENKSIRKDYVSKHFAKDFSDKILEHFCKLEEQCIFSPHVFCFDLFNTLAFETNKIESYSELFIKKYGMEFHITKEDLYSFVRDNLMNKKFSSYMDMVNMLFQKFLPNELANQEEKEIISNAWENGGKSITWYDGTREKLIRLKSLGHTLVLITNCTFPAWEEVNKILGLNEIFDVCFVSSIEGLSKPNQEICELVEKEFSGFSRNKFIMIGDNPIDDLLIPQKRGWQVYNENFISKLVL